MKRRSAGATVCYRTCHEWLYRPPYTPSRASVSPLTSFPTVPCHEAAAPQLSRGAAAALVGVWWGDHGAPALQTPSEPPRPGPQGLTAASAPLKGRGGAGGSGPCPGGGACAQWAGLSSPHPRQSRGTPGDTWGHPTHTAASHGFPSPGASRDKNNLVVKSGGIGVQLNDGPPGPPICSLFPISHSRSCFCCSPGAAVAPGNVLDAGIGFGVNYLSLDSVPR